MTFGQHLRQLRKAKGVTQRELAEKAGIHFTYLSKLETGVMPAPSEKTILALANVLDADIDELFGAAKKIPSYLLERIDSEIMRILRSSQKGVKPHIFDQAALHQYIAGHEASEIKCTGEEEALKEPERLYRALIENSLDGILLLNGELEVIYESPSAAHIFGYNQGELTGRNALVVIHADDASRVAYELTQLVQNIGDTIRGEARVRHKDGTWHILESIVQNRLHDPVVRGIIVDCRDITERRHEEQARVQHEMALVSVAKYNLTDSEKRVLTLMLEGQSNLQIAEQLVTSPSTIKFHVSNILRKLDVANRTEAVALVLQHQLIT